MTDRTSKRLAWGLRGVALVLALGSFVVLVLPWSTQPPAGTFGFRGFAAMFAIAFGTPGALIPARQPRNPIGWPTPGSPTRSRHRGTPIVYFSCLEAPQNVAKYAEASTVSVRLGQADGQLTFEVHDDGRGFDPAAASRGSGLQGIADRLAALGGSVQIRSAPGSGTSIGGALPSTPAGGTG